MYKIYINGTPLILADPAESAPPPSGPDVLTAPYTGRQKFLYPYLDMLEKTNRWREVWLLCHPLETLWKDFRGIFEWVEAAGGVAFNPQGQVLVIFRRGSWDLPKGKADEGETPGQTAIREVQEETGLQNLQLGPLIQVSYHTYRQEGKRYLKRTHWYRMQTPDLDLVPQREEDIEQAIWVDLPAFLAGNPVIYPSVREVLEGVG